MTEYGNGGGYTVTMDGPFGGGGGGSSSEKMISIHAPVSDWKGATSPYSQVVEVYGLNIGSKVDIQISTQLLEQLSQQRIWFTAENRGGVVTLLAVGDKPAIDCEFQATLSDVVNITGEDIETIRGNTVSTVIPQGDFAQKDPNKSDFIKNKPAPFVVSNEKPEGAAIWFNKKENLDDTTVDAHIMAHDLNMAQHNLYGVPAPTANDHAANMGYVNEQVKKAAPRNLLDNSDFRNPVNQRGVTSFVSDQYGIDRWVCGLVDFVATVQSDGIHLKGNGGGFWLKQLIPMGGAVKIGAKVTLVIKKNTGILHAALTIPTIGSDNSHSPAVGNVLQISTAADGSTITFVYFGNNVNEEYVIEWAALYEGEYTLDTLPEYQPKGYGVELAECRRYVIVLKKYETFAVYANQTDSVDVLIPIPAPMRVIPSIQNAGTINVGAATGFTASVIVMGGTSLRIRLNKTNHGSTSLWAEIKEPVVISADL